jgi:hypothetical protein
VVGLPFLRSANVARDGLPDQWFPPLAQFSARWLRAMRPVSGLGAFDIQSCRRTEVIHRPEFFAVRYSISSDCAANR